jgi:ubiquinone/menaquinone biosynthesis C-methylase UbiE
MPIIGNLIYRTYNSKSRVEFLQQRIRDEEWSAISHFVLKSGRFLDVGCGAGYAMFRAKTDMSCEVFGVDPSPGEHGVGRFMDKFPKNGVFIQQAFAESLPFEDESFDTVYSSHVLEHVNDEHKALEEMARVLKANGVAIIGMPTATMAWINWFSQIFFTTHIKVYEFFRFFGVKGRVKRFVDIFRITSHSYPRSNTITYDFCHYRTSNWERTILRTFDVEVIIKPALYPFPDFIQWFPLHRNIFGSSSVFFVCRKKSR